MPVYWTSEAERQENRFRRGLNPYAEEPRTPMTVGPGNIRRPEDAPTVGGLRGSILRPPTEAPQSIQPTQTAAAGQRGMTASEIRGILLGRDRQTMLTPLEVKFGRGIGLSEKSRRERFLKDYASRANDQALAEKRAQTRTEELAYAKERDLVPLKAAGLTSAADVTVAETNRQAKIESAQLTTQASRDVASIYSGANREIAKQRFDNNLALMDKKIEIAKSNNDASALRSYKEAKLKSLSSVVGEGVKWKQPIEVLQPYIMQMMSLAEINKPQTAETPTQPSAQQAVATEPDTTLPPAGTVAGDLNGDDQVSPDEQKYNALSAAYDGGKERMSPSERLRAEQELGRLKKIILGM